jgi:hypothetical protein
MDGVTPGFDHPGGLRPGESAKCGYPVLGLEQVPQPLGARSDQRVLSCRAGLPPRRHYRPAGRPAPGVRSPVMF